MEVIAPRYSLERILPTASRALVWGILLLCLYLLRSFFLLIFLSFVGAYVQTTAVSTLEPIIKSWRLRAVLVGLAFLGVPFLIGYYLGPRIGLQAKQFAAKIPVYLHSLDREIVSLGESYPFVGELLENDGTAAEDPSLSASPSMKLIHSFFGSGSDVSGSNFFRHALEAARGVGGVLIAAASAFFLSSLFSFLIVFDLPSLRQKARSLSQTRLGPIYDEVAPSIVTFSKVLGHALEAQLLIAILNTCLTAFGLYFLGLGDNIAFLSLIVFLCSFIPVAGVFVSSVPICLVGLQVGGPKLMFLGIGMITIVHMVEAYILNPKIYGHRFHMNPVIALIILTIAGKLFHVWGLILGIPVVTYIFEQAVCGSPPKDLEVPKDSGV